MVDGPGGNRFVGGQSSTPPRPFSDRAMSPDGMYIRLGVLYILIVMAKHLVDLNEEALESARAELGTTTIKDTVNEALRRASDRREDRIGAALSVLADAELDDRADAWR